MAIGLYIAAVVFVIILIYRFINRYNLPPGPYGLPLIGNLFSFVNTPAHVPLYKWAQEYGSIMSIYILDRLVIVLNDYSMVKEALIKQGENFSGRPRFHILNTFKGEEENILGIINTDGWHWKQQRKFTIKALTHFGFSQSLMQEEKIGEEAQTMVEYLDQKITDSKSEAIEDDIMGTCKATSACLLCSMLIGQKFEYGDPFFEKFQAAIKENFYLIQEQMKLDFVPFLRPFSEYFGLDKAVINNKLIQDYCLKLIGEHKKEGQIDPSLYEEPTDLIYGYLAEIEKRRSDPNQEKNGFNETQLLALLSDMLLGAFETTAVTLGWLFLYLLHYPEIQAKMQAEIDSKIGGFAKWSQRDKLPFCKAVIAETQRCANVVPLGVFHSNYEKAKLKGYTIPKRSIICINHTSVMKDPNFFPEPQKFNPSRFINPDGSFQNNPDGVIPFTAGMRTCIGDRIAKVELLMFSTAILHRFNISSPSTGMPSIDPILGFLLTPKPYKITLTRRQLLR